MKMVLEAVKFANNRHRGQVRRGSGDPYVTHTIAVSYLVAAFKRSKHLEAILVAAILHDVLEDTATTFSEIARRFSPMVASLVQELTNDEAEIAKIGKLAYQTKKLLGMSSYGLVIKLADRLHNVSDRPTQKMIEDTLELMCRLKKGRKLSKTHKELVAAIEEQCRAQAQK